MRSILLIRILCILINMDDSCPQCESRKESNGRSISAACSAWCPLDWGCRPAARRFSRSAARLSGQASAGAIASGDVAADRGASGGYRLAKPAAKITLLDITLAIEGPEPAFRCTEIRQQGPCAAAPSACKHACAIAKAFADAETQWRKALASISVADIITTAASESFDRERRRTFQAWLNGAVK